MCGWLMPSAQQPDVADRDHAQAEISKKYVAYALKNAARLDEFAWLLSLEADSLVASSSPRRFIAVFRSDESYFLWWCVSLAFFFCNCLPNGLANVPGKVAIQLE